MVRRRLRNGVLLTFAGLPMIELVRRRLTPRDVDHIKRAGLVVNSPINWIMGMANRPLGGGMFMARAMMSLEPFTVGKCGYPDLVASGELCNRDRLHDRQHPHDLFMELAARYTREITKSVAYEIYGAPVGEPALGPTAYPHRVSAMPNPFAPISHP